MLGPLSGFPRLEISTATAESGWELGFIEKNMVNKLFMANDLYIPECFALMGANPLRGQVGGGWAMEIETFLGPVKWHRTVRRVPFGAQKSVDFQGPTLSNLPSLWICTHQKHYVLGHINQRSIGSCMYMSSHR